MAKKKSILLYLDNYTESMKSLSFEQKGMLFDAIIAHGGGIADMPDDMGLLSLAFDPIKATMDRDQEKYEQVCERNRKNGLKGGKPKRTQNNPVGSSGLVSEPTLTHSNPNKPDKDKDKDTIQIKTQEKPLPPSGGDSDQKPKSEFSGTCPAANKDPKKYHPKFQEFWQACPSRPNGSKGSKFNAFRAWWIVMRDKVLTPDEIIGHMVRLAPTYGQYPKDAERWIKGAMWQGTASGAPRGPGNQESPLSFDEINDNYLKRRAKEEGYASEQGRDSNGYEIFFNKRPEGEAQG